MLNHLLGRQVVFLFATILGAHPSGQCFALLKIGPDDFLFAAIHGAHPLGQLKLLKIVPDDFLFAAILGAHPSGQLKLLKIVPDDFFFKKQRPHRRKNVIMSQVFY
ncbi:hypothetical protein [Rheinheimera sp. MM224]|uniref:hypothetical protein n=1 Tax=Rheinheimera sp. MM224 TaxID=3019969 RepID=UPI0021F8852B|nr:hypothetical protein [Rheinheimera sp. MM224]CAI3806735.1 hypothetical protein JAMGFMIE_04280 [Rheinheimera sp. MM224]